MNCASARAFFIFFSHLFAYSKIFLYLCSRKGLETRCNIRICILLQVLMAPETVAMQAGRIMLQRIDELLPQKVDFAIETTLATRSYVQLVHRAQALGYKIHLIFFALENEEQAIQRVAQRVSNGGHDIPESDIRRRFQRGIYNLIHLYMPICDNALVYNNAHGDAILVAKLGSSTGDIQVYEQEMWNQLMLRI